jgi:hypothetical protein
MVPPKPFALASESSFQAASLSLDQLERISGWVAQALRSSEKQTGMRAVKPSL